MIVTVLGTDTLTLTDADTSGLVVLLTDGETEDETDVDAVGVAVATVSSLPFDNTMAPTMTTNSTTPKPMTMFFDICFLLTYLERVWGVEPHSTGWKPVVIPIYDTR